MLGLIRPYGPQGCSGLQLLCRPHGRVGSGIGAGLVAGLLGLVYYLQPLPVRVVFAQVGFRYLVTFQNNCSGALAEL